MYYYGVIYLRYIYRGEEREKEREKNRTGHSNGLVTRTLSPIEYLSTNNCLLKKMRRFVFTPLVASLCTGFNPREREREREREGRNKFSAMKDSLFLRSNILARERREKPLLREEGERESTISSFITSPPINQYTLRFPIALERFISSIPHPWGAVIFVCTGCALSQPTYKYRRRERGAGSRRTRNRL